MTIKTGVVLAVALLAGEPETPSTRDATIRPGRDVYELAIGQLPISVRPQGGDWQPATRTHACRACHGDAGEGSSEGTIAAPALALRWDDGDPRWRAWIDDALSRNRGQDKRPLGAAMPRYRMSPANLTALTAYIAALPRAPVPGVSADAITIGLDTDDAGLGVEGGRVLTESLDELASAVQADGGIFGRRLRFVADDDRTSLIDLAWRAGPRVPARPTVSIRPSEPKTMPPGAISCGSIDPSESDRTRALTAWIEKQGQSPVTVDGRASADIAGKVVILTGQPAIDPAGLAKATMVYAPADVVGRWPAADRPARLGIVAPGDIDARAKAARALMTTRSIGAREAMVIAVYLEGASRIVGVLRSQGRSIHRMGFCEAIAADTRTAQQVTIIANDRTTIIPATD